MIPTRALLVAAVAALVLGCSHPGGTAQVTAPPAEQQAVSATRLSDSNSGVGLMFLYEGEADLLGNATLRPVRARDANAIGDHFIVDLTSILGEGKPCSDCVQLTDLEIDGSKLDISLGMKHPFPVGPDPSQGTPTARNDLHVFDVRGYMVPRTNGPVPITIGGIQIDSNGDGTRDQPASVVAGHLLNPDGYGPEFQLFAEPFLGSLPGNVHPFKDFFWDPTLGNFAGTNPNGFADVRHPSGQNVFRQGTIIGDQGSVQTYQLQTVNGHVNFYFMVTCAYGASATYANSVANPTAIGSRSNPKYFLPAFHRPEAVRVTATLARSLGANNPASQTNLTVTVVDWQGAKSAKNGALTLTDPPDTLPFPSDVKEVVVDIPGVLNGPITRQAPDIGDGSAANPYQYVISILNQKSAAQGKYPGLVAVRDQYSDHVPSAPQGVQRDLTPLALREYTTFQGLVVQVGPATAGQYAVDTTRKNLDLTGAIYTGRTGADVELDLSVVDQGDPTTDGVYMPATGNAGLVRYALDYTSGTVYGAALTPLYTPNVVPDPSNPPPGFDPTKKMPITHLDLGYNCAGFASATEDFNSMLFDEAEDPPGTQTGQRDLANTNLFFNYYRSTKPPAGEGPVIWFEDKTSTMTGQPFAFLPGVYNDNPATPENEFLLCLADNPVPADCFEAGIAGDGKSYYGGVWINSQDATNGNRPFQVLRCQGSVPGTTRGLNATGLINQLNFALPEFSAIHIVASDMLYLGSGTEEVWMAFATNHIIALRWQGVAGSPGTTPEGVPRANIALTDGIPVDMELLPYKQVSPLTINGVVQTTPIVVVLTDAGTIEVLNDVYSAAPVVMQSINLAAVGILGDPKHVDLDDLTSDIHITTLDGSTPKVSVLKLQ